MLAQFGRPEIPVAAGAAEPLKYRHTFPDYFRKDVNNAYGMKLSKNSNQPRPEGAVEFLKATLEANPNATILAIGGGTNLGLLTKRYPKIGESIGRLVVMGGVINHPPDRDIKVYGNVHGFKPEYKNEVAEWNMFIDPEGAATMLDLAANTTLVPLNATNQVPIEMPFIDALEAHVNTGRPTPSTDLIYRFLKEKEGSVRSGHFYFWDQLAAVLITHPEFATYRSTPISVVQEFDQAHDRSGQTLPGGIGRPMQVAMNVPNPEFVKKELLTVLTQERR